MGGYSQKITKVCHIVDSLSIGGLEKIIIEIIFNLKGYEQAVWCLKEKGILAQHVEQRGIKVRNFDFGGSLRFSAANRLASELKKERFDIVHCHGFFPSIWGRIAAIMAGIPIRIVHCQNIYYGIPFRERLKFIILTYFTTKIIAVSEAVKRCLTEYLKINPHKIVVVYNSASAITPIEQQERVSFRKSLGLGDEDFVVGSVARLIPIKGHRTLIDAISQCKRFSPQCKCIIVGDGPERERLALQIKGLGLEGRVLLLGWRRDVHNLLSIIDVFVLPSLEREGLPLVLAEASAAGLPLLVTDVGGNAEIAKDGFNALHFGVGQPEELAEKIEFLMSNPEERKRMGENSKKIWKDKFTTEIMLERIDAIYKASLTATG
ncbi:MAG: glycosyltransferase [Candidatus Omnitrophica bacterium]|nr:glycosyltransferase [Candidatus Omnitrophota bacterium]